MTWVKALVAVALSVSLVSGPVLAARDEAPASRPAQDVKVGPSRITFSERSRLSDPETIGNRVGWTAAQLKRDKVTTEYDLADESFPAGLP